MRINWPPHGQVAETGALAKEGLKQLQLVAALGHAATQLQIELNRIRHAIEANRHQRVDSPEGYTWELHSDSGRYKVATLTGGMAGTPEEVWGELTERYITMDCHFIANQIGIGEPDETGEAPIYAYDYRRRQRCLVTSDVWVGLIRDDRLESSPRLMVDAATAPLAVK